MLGALPNESDDAQKAIDLCWLFHLIEDIHQPLHAACLFDTKHPDGDRGGNTTFIRFPNSAQLVVLHSYWDALIKGAQNKASSNALILFNKPIYTEANLVELTSGLTVHDWIVGESLNLAQKEAYKDGAINGTKNNPKVVDNSYSASSSRTGERRVVLSGIRLGKKLEDIFK